MDIASRVQSNIPALVQSIVAVQSVASQIPGSDRKEIVLSGFQAAAQVGEQVDVPYVQAMSFLVDMIVGILKKKHPAFTPEPAAVKTSIQLPFSPEDVIAGRVKI